MESQEEDFVVDLLVYIMKTCTDCIDKHNSDYKDLFEYFNE